MLQKVEAIVARLRLKLRNVANCVGAGAEGTLRYMNYPREHWRSIHTNNPLEHIMRHARDPPSMWVALPCIPLGGRTPRATTKPLSVRSHLDPFEIIIRILLIIEYGGGGGDFDENDTSGAENLLAP